MATLLPLREKIDRTASANVKFLASTATFGDGRQQVAPVGLSNKKLSYEITWKNLSIAEKEALVTFLNTTGTWNEILWTAPYESIEQTWLIDKDYKVFSDAQDAWTVTTTIHKAFNYFPTLVLPTGVEVPATCVVVPPINPDPIPTYRYVRFTSLSTVGGSNAPVVYSFYIAAATGSSNLCTIPANFSSTDFSDLSNLCDGNMTTKATGLSSGTVSQKFTYDIGYLTTITELGFTACNTYSEAGKVDHFKLEVSTDNSTWTTFVESTEASSIAILYQYFLNRFTEGTFMPYWKQPCAYLPLNGSVVDQNLHTVPVATSISYGSDDDGSYASFNGTSSKIDLATAVQPGTFSFACWVKITEYPTIAQTMYALLSKNSYFATAINDFPCVFGINSDGYLTLKVDAGNNYVYDYTVTGTVKVPLNEKVLCVCGFIDGGGSFYVSMNNNTTSGNVPLGFFMITGSRNWTIGNAPFLYDGGVTDPCAFKGKMYEASWWAGASVAPSTIGNLIP